MQIELTKEIIIKPTLNGFVMQGFYGKDFYADYNNQSGISFAIVERNVMPKQEDWFRLEDDDDINSHIDHTEAPESTITPEPIVDTNEDEIVIEEAPEPAGDRSVEEAIQLDNIEDEQKLKAFLVEAEENGLTPMELYELKQALQEPCIDLALLKGHEVDKAAEEYIESETAHHDDSDIDPGDAIEQKEFHTDEPKIVSVEYTKEEVKSDNILDTMPEQDKKLYTEMINATSLFGACGIAKMLLRQSERYAPLCQPYIDKYDESVKAAKANTIKPTTPEPAPEVKDEPKQIFPEVPVDEIVSSSETDAIEFLKSKAAPKEEGSKAPQQAPKQPPF